MKPALLGLLFPLWILAQPAPKIEPADPLADKFHRVESEMRKTAPAVPAASSDTRSLPLLVLQVGAALLLVLGAAVLSIRLLRKAQRGLLRGSTAGGELLEVIESCHLGPGQRLVAVRMDGLVGIVGVTKEGMSLLVSLPRSAEEILAERRRTGNPALFAQQLNGMLERFKKPKKVSEFIPPEGA